MMKFSDAFMIRNSSFVIYGSRFQLTPHSLTGYPRPPHRKPVVLPAAFKYIIRGSCKTRVIWFKANPSRERSDRRERK